MCIIDPTGSCFGLKSWPPIQLDGRNNDTQSIGSCTVVSGFLHNFHDFAKECNVRKYNISHLTIMIQQRILF